MQISEASRIKIRNALNILKVFGGMALLVAISWEIIGNRNLQFSQRYLNVQLIVCLLFLGDFLANWAADRRPVHFFFCNLASLLISIPYLNIMNWYGVDMMRDSATLIGFIPLLRAFLAFYIVVQWLVGNRIQRLLMGYVVTMVVFTYLAALVFYNYEQAVNDKLDGFGNALWWAWMNVTTVGAEIFPVTTIGKIFAVLLPLLGMMMFPIITTYIMQQYSTRNKKKSDQ